MAVGDIGGKYTLERELAHGGMGHIWVAFDPQLRRRVAIKRMTAEQVASPPLRQRFEREALSIAQLRNPHVVQIYDYGLDDGAPYIVMELLEGEVLESRLGRLKRLSMAQALPLMAQAAKGLAAAHASAIVHRDLKPANIFLSKSDGDETVKLLDFGLVTMALAEEVLHKTQAGTVLGTPHYMSPEQMRGRAVDHRSDLWSLGVVAYRAVTGEFPFRAEAIGDLALKICMEPPPAPSTLAPDLFPEVDRFFDKALAKDPASRFQSAREMAGAFAALADAATASPTTKILVVDDEPDVALLMKQRFRQQIRNKTYEFVFANDGEEALEQLRRHPDVDLALSDINMPSMDGLTFLGRAAESAPMTKVIIVSAYSDMTNIRTAMNRGAFDFLVKPIDFRDLEATIDKTVRHVREVRRTMRSTEENSLLRMFVSSGIAERMLPMLRTADLMANEAVSATVMFIDVCDFTRLTRTASPDVVVRALNANFDVILPEITARTGMVDKIVGDAVMAVYRGPDHTLRAVESAVAIRARLADLAERAHAPSPYAHGVAVGIDSGMVISGGLGSKAFGRLDFTVLGDAVNNAARLAQVATRNQICVGASLQYRLADFFECESIGAPELPGTSEQVQVYNVVRKLVEDKATWDSMLVTVSVDAPGGLTMAETPHSLKSTPERG